MFRLLQWKYYHPLVIVLVLLNPMYSMIGIVLETQDTLVREKVEDGV